MVRGVYEGIAQYRIRSRQLQQSGRVLATTEVSDILHKQACMYLEIENHRVHSDRRPRVKDSIDFIIFGVEKSNFH